MMKISAAVLALRREYSQQDLDEQSAAADPVEQFQQWFDQAVQTATTEPNAMTLATATPDGRPSARIVLLKQFDERGFVFHTNYEGRKGHELTVNPWAALVFWWDGLERQVRIEGEVEKIAAEESDAYFAGRPWGSQLSAWVSPQSQVISGRAYLEEQWERLKKQYPEGTVPRPAHWGGYRLKPLMIEFWQGRQNRLHDRLRYRRRTDQSWLIERLAP